MLIAERSNLTHPEAAESNWSRCPGKCCRGWEEPGTEQTPCTKLPWDEVSSASQCFQGNQSWNSVLLKVHQIPAFSDIIFFTGWTSIFGSCFWTVAPVCMAMSSISKGTIGRRYTFLEMRGSSFAFSSVIVPWEHRHHCTVGSMGIWWDHLFLRVFSNGDISRGWKQALISLFSWWCNIITYIK